MSLERLGNNAGNTGIEFGILCSDEFDVLFPYRLCSVLGLCYGIMVQTSASVEIYQNEHNFINHLD